MISSHRLEDTAWLRVDSIGEGEDFRAQSSDGATASALCLDGCLVHVSSMAR